MRTRHALVVLALGTLVACARENTRTTDTPSSTTSPVALQVQEAVCAELETVTAGDLVVSEAAQATVDEASCEP